MPAILSIDNPIAWAQFHLRGGWRTAAWSAVAYTVLIGGIILVTLRLNQAHYQETMAGWTLGLLALQALLITGLGSMRITNAIRQDITTGIIESHRMMPLPPANAIAGYLLGTLAHGSPIFIANLAMGAVTSTLAQFPPQRWIMGNLILLLFTLFIWVISAFAAFLAKGAGALLSIFAFSGFFSQGAVFVILPGAVVLVGPLLGGTIFSMRTAQTELSGPVLLSAAAQFLLGAIFFAGAMRKYRRPDVLALGILLSNLLLLMWVAANLLAILRPEDFQIRFLRIHRDEKVALVGAIISSMLIALVPLSNAARSHVDWVKRRGDDPTLPRRAFPPALAAVLAAAIISLLLLGAPIYSDYSPALPRLVTIIALGGFSLSIVFVAAWAYLIADNARILIGLWLFLTCLLPIAFDITGAAIADTDHAIGLLSSLSPIGLIIEAWAGINVDFRTGAVAQIACCAIPAVLYFGRVKRPENSSSAKPPLLPPRDDNGSGSVYSADHVEPDRR